jgi:hypothetical protein
MKQASQKPDPAGAWRLNASGHRLEDLLVDNPGEVESFLPSWVWQREVARVADVINIITDPAAFRLQNFSLLAGPALAEFA